MLPQFGAASAKDIKKVKYVQRNYTLIVCYRCSITKTSYQDSLVKLKSLEYRFYKLDLDTLLKTINGIRELYFVQYLKIL